VARSLRVGSPQNFASARVYFARPQIAIAKIRDYSQSIHCAAEYWYKCVLIILCGNKIIAENVCQYATDHEHIDEGMQCNFSVVLILQKALSRN